MNFQQLRIIRETVRQNFNLTEAANVLLTSQSGVSRHIRDLEDELGFEIFVRRGKRLLGLTDPGREVAAVVERILLETQNLEDLSSSIARRDSGALIVATTHTAGSLLPPGGDSRLSKRPSGRSAHVEATQSERYSECYSRGPRRCRDRYGHAGTQP